MRVSILSFIFIISEYSIITGGDGSVGSFYEATDHREIQKDLESAGNCGNPPEVENAKKVKNVIEHKFRMACKEGYLRKAGTSNLFKCSDYKWVNYLPLVCIRDPRLPKADDPTVIHISGPPVTSSWSSPTPKTYSVTTPPKRNISTSTTSGKIAFTTTHTTSTTPRTFCQTSQRTTTMEETSETTSIPPRITTSSTEKENLISVSSQTPSNFSTTSNGNADTGFRAAGNESSTTGITTGIGIAVIIAALAATVALFFWRRRSRSRGHSVEMTLQNPCSDQPLIITHTLSISRPPGSIQPEVTPFEDSPKTTYSEAPPSAL